MPDLKKRIAKKVEEISKTADDYPGIVIVHNIQEQHILYLSTRGLRGIKKTMDEVRYMGLDEYHRRYFNPEDADSYFSKIKKMLLCNDPHEMVSFFQQVRTAENGDWEWFLTSLKVLMNDDAGRPLLTIAFAVSIDAESHVTNKINRILEENTFLKHHHENFYSLGKREKEVLKSISLGKSTIEISQEMHISQKTVETHRKNIKRKLNIKSPYDLQLYARAFDLI